jgi:hypothetical protein
MKSKTTLSKKDLVVVSTCILIIIMNIGAINTTGRRRAKEMVCLSNLHKWGVIFTMYTQDNNGNFFSGNGSGFGLWWIKLLESYYKDTKLLRCPETTESRRFIGENAFRAWYSSGYIGSYGINGWICNPRESVSSVWGRGPTSHYWRRPDITGVNHIPVYLDTWYVDAWPRHTDSPPISVGPPPDRTNVDEMSRVCVNRHNAALNCLFMDWSARKVGLKELWTFKWNRQFDTSGPWTKAGGVRPDDWPEWMRSFKDY